MCCQKVSLHFSYRAHIRLAEFKYLFQLSQNSHKHVFGSFFIFILFYILLIYCRKVGKNNRSLCSFFRKNMLKHPHRCQHFWRCGYFHIITYQVFKLKQNTKSARSVSVCAWEGCHCTKGLHKMCKTSWWKK